MNKGFMGIPSIESAPMVWVIPALTAAWVDFSATEQGVGYAKDEKTGLVYLRGKVKSGTISTTVPLFILPGNYRPISTLTFAVISNAAIGRCDVTSAGLVLPYAGNNTYFSLNGIVFQASI